MAESAFPPFCLLRNAGAFWSVATGVREPVADIAESYAGQCLKNYLARTGGAARRAKRPALPRHQRAGSDAGTSWISGPERSKIAVK